MQVCKNRFLISKTHRAFASKSDPSKVPYRVYAFREGQVPMCTCMPFLAGRKREAKKLGVKTSEISYHCSHLKRVFAETCDWQQLTATDYQWSHKCPQCGDDLVDTDDVSIPDDPEGQIDDLRALLADLATPPADPGLDPGTGGDASTAAASLLEDMGQ